MPQHALADSLITGAGARVLLAVLALVVGPLLWVIGRTSPRVVATQPATGWLAVAGGYLWRRARNRTTEVLAAATAAGGAICCVASLLAFVTFTDPPLFPGDPFAGPSEHDPTARGLALVLGLIIGLLALRRFLGGEGNTVAVTAVAAVGLELVAALAISDYVGNSQPLSGPYAVTVAPGPGLIVLPLGAAVVLGACVVDVICGLRRAAHDATSIAVLPPMPLPPSLHPPLPPSLS